MCRRVKRLEVKLIEAEIATLKIDPGDMLVITFSEYLTEETIARLKEILMGHLPACKVMILDGGIGIQKIKGL